jgi:hypothetical protein
MYFKSPFTSFSFGAASAAATHYLYTGYNRVTTQANGITIGKIENFREPSQFGSGEITISAPSKRDFVLFDLLQVSRPFAKYSFSFNSRELDPDFLNRAMRSREEVRLTYTAKPISLRSSLFGDGTAVAARLEKDCEKIEAPMESLPDLPPGHVRYTGQVDYFTTPTVFRPGKISLVKPGRNDFGFNGEIDASAPTVNFNPADLTKEAMAFLERARLSGEQVTITAKKPPFYSLFNQDQGTAVSIAPSKENLPRWNQRG